MRGGEGLPPRGWAAAQNKVDATWLFEMRAMPQSASKAGERWALALPGTHVNAPVLR